MSPRRLSVAVAALAALSLTGPDRLGSQVVIDRFGGELAADFVGRFYQVSDRPNDDYRTLQEWLLVQVGGSLSDPRLVRFDVALRPLLGQRGWSGSEASPNGSIQRLDGRGKLQLLSGAPVTLALDGLWSSDDQVLRYGAEQAVDLSTWGARFDAKWQPLPLWVEYRDAARRQVSRPRPGVVLSRDEGWRTFRAGAANRKTRLLFERLDYDDRLGDFDFAQDRLDADHRLQWGKGSRLNSRFQWLDRTGSGAVERLSWSQRARLQHTRIVASDLGYSLSDQETPFDFRRGWGADYTASWRAHRAVELSAGGEARSSEFRLGTQGYARVGPRAVVDLPLARRVALRVAARTGYEWHSQSVSEEGVGMVVDERHVLGPGLSFFLDEPLADPATIVLRSEDATLVYEPGLDYRLVPTGALIEVVGLPGGQFVAGQVVLADYAYRLLPGGSANAWTYDYDVTLALGPVAIYHRRARQDEVGNGPPTPIASLREYDDMTVGARVSSATSIGTLSVDAAYDDRSARTYAFSGYHVRGGWGFLLGRGLRGGISGGWSRRENGTVYEIGETEASLEWRATRTLQFVGRLAAYDWNETDSASVAPLERGEQFIGGSLGFEWRIRKLVVAARYDRNSWSLSNERTEDRVYVRIGREF